MWFGFRQILNSWQDWRNAGKGKTRSGLYGESLPSGVSIRYTETFARSGHTLCLKYYLLLTGLFLTCVLKSLLKYFYTMYCKPTFIFDNGATFYCVVLVEIGGCIRRKHPGLLWPMTSWEYFKYQTSFYGTDSQRQVVVLLHLLSCFTSHPNV